MAIGENGNYRNVNARNGVNVEEGAESGRGGGLRTHHYTQVRKFILL